MPKQSCYIAMRAIHLGFSTNLASRMTTSNNSIPQLTHYIIERFAILWVQCVLKRLEAIMFQAHLKYSWHDVYFSGFPHDESCPVYCHGLLEWVSLAWQILRRITFYEFISITSYIYIYVAFIVFVFEGFLFIRNTLN